MRMMKKYGVREIRPTITDLGQTDLVPSGMGGVVQEGYLLFCRNHPGFDDEALKREAVRVARLNKKRRKCA
jgi:hypothetical protein